MGASKTICYCASRKCKSLAGLGDDREQLRQNLETYLAEEVCVPGISDDDLVIDPYVQTIAHAAVLAALGSNASFRGNDVSGALECQSTLARSAGLMLEHAYALTVGASSADAAGVVPVELNDWLGREDRPDRVPELGRLLERSLTRACAELAAAARLDDASSMQHHTALVVDLVTHVLNLTNEHDEASSETLLDPAHGHHRAVGA